MLQIRLQQLFLHKNTLVRMGRLKEMRIAYLSAQFSNTQFKWSTVVKEVYAINSAVKTQRHYLEDAEILLKSDAKSLQKFLVGRTDNVNCTNDP